MAASPRHHTQNDGTPIQQVTAHWWLPHHSTLDWFANSVWSQPWLHTPPWHHKSSQWRVESGWWNKHTSCRYFGLYGDTPPPPPPTPRHWSMCTLVSQQHPVCVNKICIFFWRMHNDSFEPNHYEPVSGRIIGLRISLASQESRILLNLLQWSVIISSQLTEDTILNKESETTQCA